MFSVGIAEEYFLFVTKYLLLTFPIELLVN